LSGTYSGTLTVTDHDGTGQATTVNWSTNATQVPTSVVVAPSGTTPVGTGGTISYTATVYDQSTPMPQVISPTPALTWSIDGGGAGNSINGSGVFSANGAVGSYIVRATVNSNGATGIATAKVDPTAPSFSVAPAATVFVTTVSLTATGTAFSGHPLTYTWSLVSGKSPIDYNPNGTSATTVIGTLHGAGNYTVKCTVTDTVNSLTASANVSFAVGQVLGKNGITVSPDNITIKALQDQMFTASGVDQFGDPMGLSGVQWSLTGGGAISGAGVLSAPSLGQSITVIARQGSVSGAAHVTVVNFDVSGAIAYPVPYKSTFSDHHIHFKGLGSSAKIRIYTAAGRKVFDTETSGDTFDWDVKNKSSESLASGVYFYVIESPETKKDGKLIIIQ
jgi:hypothetical protein